MNEGLLSQQEINSLLQKNEELNNYTGITEGEKDVLGEVSNISMGSAIMALSEDLGKEASLSGMQINTTSLPKLKEGLDEDYVVLQAQFESGIKGTTMLILNASTAAVIIELVAGKEATDRSAKFSDSEISGISEAMNKMLDSLHETVADMIKKDITKSKSNTWILGPDTDMNKVKNTIDGDIIKIDFNLHIDGIDDSSIALVFCLESARNIINGLSSLNDSDVAAQPKEEENKVIPKTGADGKRPVSIQKPQFGQLKEDATDGKKQNIDLILDVPLELSVVLGDTTKSIKEVLSLNPGSVIELGKYTEEPLEVYVNGKLIAQGEVVVINENFGIRITNIISAAERVKRI